MASPDTLLLLSGGIDSAYCMWKLLSEGRSLRVHHVHLTNHEGRVTHEAEATERVLAWMRGQGLTRFSYSTSSFNYGTLGFIVKDSYLWAFHIGVIMANPRNRAITKVIVPRHYDAFPTGPTGPGPERTDRVWREIPRQVCGRVPELEYPIVDMMKADIVRAIPPDLLECCWWCRTPKNGKPCHTCYTCKLVDPALPKGA